MKKILFDGISLQSTNKFAGGAEYTKEILKKLNSEDCDLDIVFDSRKSFPEDMKEFCTKMQINMIECNGRNDVPELLKNNAYDVFYSGVPYEFEGVKFPFQVKFVYTIHGLRTIETHIDRYFLYYGNISFKLKTIAKMFLNRFFYNQYLKKKRSEIRRLIDSTDNRKIITDSFHSKYSISNNFPDMDVNQICVCYAPMSEFVIPEEIDEKAILKKYGISVGRYIMMMSCNRPEKNCYRGVVALKELFKDKHEVMTGIKVLMLGASGVSAFEKIKDKNPDIFVVGGYVDKVELEILLKNAHLMLYPTLNEGFGYPPINAMRYNTLCACSAITSVTEACGDAVLYFNPFDIQEMKVRILESFDENIVLEKKKAMHNQYEKIRNKQITDLSRIGQEILC